MTDLLSRLFAATEGSAELDRDVLLACGWRPENAHEVDWFDPKRPDRWILRSDLPRPTRSLDDITRMIEGEGMEWQSGVNYAFVGNSISAMSTLNQPGKHPDRRVALCIAFLRAREVGR